MKKTQSSLIKRASNTVEDRQIRLSCLMPLIIKMRETIDKATCELKRNRRIMRKLVDAMRFYRKI